MSIFLETKRLLLKAPELTDLDKLVAFSILMLKLNLLMKF